MLHKKLLSTILPQSIKRVVRPYYMNTPYQQCHDDTKAIFIHIPKCGGVSVAKALYGQEVGHKPLWKFQEYDSERFYKYFKFTIVRNPWDRLVSAFFFLRGGGMKSVDAEWAKENIDIYRDFDDFVRHIYEKKTRKRVLAWKHFRPQWHYIIDSCGEIASLDYVGRLETLTQDFAHIKEELGIVTDLPHENTSQRKPDYRTYYTDETAEIVEEVYREDICLFSYQFDEYQDS